MKKAIYFLLLVIIQPAYLIAQQSTVHNHFFLNPYIYNPAFVGANGVNELYLTHRQQWRGIEGAPVTSTLSFQVPINGKLSFGTNIINDKAGLLSNTSAVITVGYAAQLGDDHYLRGGLSIGGSMNSIDLSQVENASDPALANVFSNNKALVGSAGIGYQNKGFKLGMSIPNVFNRKVLTTSAFNEVKVSKPNTYLFMTSYKIPLSYAVAVEPQVLYRMMEGNPSQFEALGTVYFYDKFWVGGSYRQSYSPTAFAGFKISNTVNFGYSYEPASAQVAGYANGSHEVLLGITFGKKKTKTRPERTASTPDESLKDDKKDEVAKEDTLSNDEKAAQKQLADRNGKPGENTALEVDPATKNTVSTKPSTKPPADKTIKSVTPKDDYSAARTYKRTDNPMSPGDFKEEDFGLTEEKVRVKQKTNPLELEPGHYVVVGAFRIFDNVIKFNKYLKSVGYNSEYRYSSETLYYYEFILRTGDISQARDERDKMRQLAGFEDAWVLTVE